MEIKFATSILKLDFLSSYQLFEVCSPVSGTWETQHLVVDHIQSEPTWLSMDQLQSNMQLQAIDILAGHWNIWSNT